MRIRTIKPEFWAHPVIGRMSDAAKALAIGLLNFADDEGYFHADPLLVRSALRPFDEDSTNTRRALDECSRAGWIEVREHPEHGLLARVVNFTAHQRIDRPSRSKIAPYFSDSTSIRRAFDEPSTNTRRWNREQGTGNREQERRDSNESLPSKLDGGAESVEVQIVDPDTLPGVPNAQPKPRPPDDTPYDAILETWSRVCPHLPQPQIPTARRKKTIRAFWKRAQKYAKAVQMDPDEWFVGLCEIVAASDFLSGRRGDWKGADLWWCIREENTAKIVDGNYDNKRRAG